MLGEPRAPKYHLHLRLQKAAGLFRNLSSETILKNSRHPLKQHQGVFWRVVFILKCQFHFIVLFLGRIICPYYQTTENLKIAKNKHVSLSSLMMSGQIHEPLAAE